MEIAANVSSEEDLLRLRDEGKISEAEYQDLLGAMKKTTKWHIGPADQEEPKPARTSGLAIASLACSLLGPVFCIPAIICGHLALRRIGDEPTLRGRGIAIAGLVIGYIMLGISLTIMALFSLLFAAKIQTRVTPYIPASNAIELKRFPLDNTEGLITKTGVQIDRQVSSDGNGSLRVLVTEPTTIPLFETGEMDIENARLIYQARVRTENMDGKVYLEMLCHFPGRGEFFSKGLMTPLTGTTDWTTQETPFFLKKGENPDNIKLNLVIDGRGTAWIDDLRLIKVPLR
jgi:hypothetical protein